MLVCLKKQGKVREGSIVRSQESGGPDSYREGVGSREVPIAIGRELGVGSRELGVGS